MEFLDWLQNTGLATWISQSDSIWVYPGVLTAHTIGLSLLVGVSAALDLRLLGYAPDVPLAPLERYFPIMWVGFWINAFSGVALFAAAATTMGVNWIFYAKLAFVFAGVVLIRLIRRTVFQDRAAVGTNRVSSRARRLAAASLVVWTCAIVAGRLTAYY
jgi:hypothetical protein